MAENQTNTSSSAAARRAAITGLLLTLGCGMAAAPQAQTPPGASQIIERSGCSACHRIDEKLVGPSFRAIAARYRTKAGAAEQLADIVRNGTDDPEWGGPPMPANPPEKISDADLRQVLAYILGL